MYTFNEKDHIHLLDDKPLVGTSTAVQIISKPLTWWASSMACTELGWIKSLDKDRKATKEKKAWREIERITNAGGMLTEVKKMETKEYLALLDKAYKAHSVKLKTSAGEGTDLHAEIEKYIKREIDGKPAIHSPQINKFMDWCDKNVKRFLFSEVHCYSRPLWVGGIADFGYVDMEGKWVLGDIKSSKEAYFSQWVQLAGYDMQLWENGGLDDKGKITFKHLFPFKYHAIFAAGAGLDKPFFNHDTQRTKQAFVNAVNLYKDKMFFEKDQ